MNQVLKDLPKPFFALAPLDDVTDTVFRRIIGDCAPPDLYFTEFVNADGLQSPGRTKLLKKLRFTPGERPLIAQLWGLNPDNFRATAAEVADGSMAQELGLPKGVNFAGADLNMGCPAKSEVKNGACSALIKNRPLAKQIIDATREGLAGRLPLSVKTRLGFNEIDLTWLEFLLRQDIHTLTIHGRTRKEMSKVPAHWDEIGQIKKMRDKISPNTLIVGNGDVKNRQHGMELAERYGLDGIMIGRGVFDDPFAFSESSPWRDMSTVDRINLYRQHVTLFAETWKKGERPIVILNKFCKIYINGFPRAKEMRERLMRANSTDELIRELSDASKVLTPR